MMKGRELRRKLWNSAFHPIPSKELKIHLKIKELSSCYHPSILISLLSWPNPGLLFVLNVSVTRLKYFHYSILSPCKDIIDHFLNSLHTDYLCLDCHSFIHSYIVNILTRYLLYVRHLLGASNMTVKNKKQNKNRG